MAKKPNKTQQFELKIDGGFKLTGEIETTATPKIARHEAEALDLFPTAEADAIEAAAARFAVTITEGWQ